MNTSQIVTLAIAIFSSLISIVNAIVPTWLTRLHADRTATAKSNAHFNTHKEPVLIAAIELAHELYNFLDAGTKKWIYDRDRHKRDQSTAYLCYLFAIFFARVEALQREVRLLNLSASNIDLVKVLYGIQLVLLQRAEIAEDRLGVLRRGDIQAMVEAVGLKLESDEKEKENDAKGAELMGYATFFSLLRIEDFLNSWRMEGVQPLFEPEENERSTRLENRSLSNHTTATVDSGEPNIYLDYFQWFEQLLNGIIQMSLEERDQPRGNFDFRFRKLQHRLIDLIIRLDPDEKRVELHRGSVSDIKPVKPLLNEEVWGLWRQKDKRRCGCKCACVDWLKRHPDKREHELEGPPRQLERMVAQEPLKRTFRSQRESNEEPTDDNV